MYGSTPSTRFTYVNKTKIKLSDDERELYDQPFTIEDFKKALKSMSENKAPGLDGLTCSFYKMFFVKLGDILWDAVVEAHQTGELHPSARRGLITLIPKKEKNSMHLGNWHPLTMLTVDHKIITKMIANRFKCFPHSIIGTQQMGYIPGRFIGSNIRKLIDVMLYLEQNDQSTLFI